MTRARILVAAAIAALSSCSAPPPTLEEAARRCDAYELGLPLPKAGGTCVMLPDSYAARIVFLVSGSLEDHPKAQWGDEVREPLAWETWTLVDPDADPSGWEETKCPVSALELSMKLLAAGRREQAQKLWDACCRANPDMMSSDPVLQLAHGVVGNCAWGMKFYDGSYASYAERMKRVASKLVLTDDEKQDLDDAIATAAPSTAVTGSAEALIDELVEAHGFVLFENPSDARFLHVVQRGFEAVPALIAHLRDRRFTRIRIYAYGSYRGVVEPHGPLRVGEICAEILHDLSGGELQTHRSSDGLETMTPDDALRWWDSARRMQEGEALFRAWRDPRRALWSSGVLEGAYWIYNAWPGPPHHLHGSFDGSEASLHEKKWEDEIDELRLHSPEIPPPPSPRWIGRYGGDRRCLRSDVVLVALARRAPRELFKAFPDLLRGAKPEDADHVVAAVLDADAGVAERVATLRPALDDPRIEVVGAALDALRHLDPEAFLVELKRVLADVPKPGDDVMEVVACAWGAVAAAASRSDDPRAAAVFAETARAAEGPVCEMMFARYGDEFAPETDRLRCAALLAGFMEDTTPQYCRHAAIVRGAELLWLTKDPRGYNWDGQQCATLRDAIKDALKKAAR